MAYYPVTFGRYSRTHLITQDSDSPRETLCGKSADGAIVSVREVSCRSCSREREKRNKARK